MTFRIPFDWKVGSSCARFGVRDKMCPKRKYLGERGQSTSLRGSTAGRDATKGNERRNFQSRNARMKIEFTKL